MTISIPVLVIWLLPSLHHQTIQIAMLAVVVLAAAVATPWFAGYFLYWHCQWSLATRWFLLLLKLSLIWTVVSFPVGGALYFRAFVLGLLVGMVELVVLLIAGRGSVPDEYFDVPLKIEIANASRLTRTRTNSDLNSLTIESDNDDAEIGGRDLQSRPGKLVYGPLGT